jgi:LysR family transcriptional regulator, hydrogen peroxide-inducible genes activator
MNIQQFQYVLALAELRHFEKAAEKCFITQSTLSTMISKFEEEIGILVFDRKKKPVEITEEGHLVLEQIRKINKEIEGLTEITHEIRGEVKGKLTIAVIPTIAPYLLPLFIPGFVTRFPELDIEVREQTTGEIVRLLKSRDLDIGIVSIPLKDKELLEFKLYDEPFIFFDADSGNEKKVSAKDLDLSNLCLLEEGHCMRTQALELCNSPEKKLKSKLNFNYKAGSIDSLLRFVRVSHASTLLPYLSAIELPAADYSKVSHFIDPIPYRTIGMVVHQHFVKHKILEILQQEIVLQVSKRLPQTEINGRMLQPV